MLNRFLHVFAAPVFAGDEVKNTPGQNAERHPVVFHRLLGLGRVIHPVCAR